MKLHISHLAAAAQYVLTLILVKCKQLKY